MSVMTHAQLEESGLLDGRLDAHARAGWPAKARTHFEGCEECRCLRWAELLLLEGSSAVSPDPLNAEDPSSPFPDLEDVQRRFDAQPAPPIDVLVDSLQPFEARSYRGGALALTRTESGVHAWDPDATHLAVFALVGGAVRVLGSADEPKPGITVAAGCRPEEETLVVAVAACEALNLDLWELWFSDLTRHDLPRSIDAGEWSDRIHISEMVLRPPPAAWILRVHAEPLPEATPFVAEELKAGAAAGRLGDGRAAACHYTQALTRAASIGDRTGETKAAVGLSTSLDALGYSADAERVLTELVAGAVFDTKVGGIAARRLTWHSFVADSAEGLRRWRDEAERIDGPGSFALRPLDAARLLLADRWRAAFRLLELDMPDGTSSEVRQILGFQRAAALQGMGRRAEASDVLSALPLPEACAFELMLWRVFAEMACDVRQSVTAWTDAMEAVATDLRGRRGEITAWEARLLLELARRALRDGANTEAWALFRLRFLPVHQALNSAHDLLAVAGAGEEILVCDPARGGALHSLPLSRAQFLQLASRARAAVVEEAWSAEALGTLRSLLLPDGWKTGKTFLIASDGSLCGLPVEALARKNLRALIPVTRECTPRDVEWAGSAESTTIGSIADSLGDLPWAAREVTEREARVWRRGTEATRVALQALGTVGLLHLGLHARRDGGVPGLVFADGVLTPPEIESLQLSGRPVVLLSGCATGEMAVPQGFERSFARAFLRAGASAVIGTRWPVEDAEMHFFVRELLTLWPFVDPARAVAQVKNRLRNEGMPARLWAAPVVY